MNTYWASLFMLPSSILEAVDRACRDFLWGAKHAGSGLALVNWSAVCKEKNFGGLGLRECKLWNMALIGKQVWANG